MEEKEKEEEKHCIVKLIVFRSNQLISFEGNPNRF